MMGFFADVNYIMMETQMPVNWHLCFAFPKGFAVSQNPHHWSNQTETLKLLEKNRGWVKKI